ncbi:hypothetical protein [Mesomycoplasma ovipneumoniae]|uniref:hypothetical protein n=1 Tax=Mesomycoplasma ovipneumoniae TaxID=29562 RepID=UPI002964F69A|nr:hypothetical protein [Mesomycoplasma ovipneumoniae]MDW2861076.1 hypothetical protein [Mesomycoplasma ovipneumoniae]
MMLNFDKEFIEKDVLYRLDKISNPLLIERDYKKFKKWYDPKNLITPDITDVKFQNDDEVQEYYKKAIAKIASENAEAYFDSDQKGKYSTLLSHSPFKIGEEGIKKEINRLSEEEQAKWIKRLGKSLGTLDGKFQEEWIESEKLQWIISKQQDQFYWADKSIERLRDRMENQNANGVPKEDRNKWKKYTQFKKNDESLSWSKPLQNWEDKIKNSKWVRIYYNDSKIPPMEVEFTVSSSSEALLSIFYTRRDIYIDIDSDPYKLFSIHEPKSNFNLVNNLFSKHWKNYPDIHNHESLKRRDAFRSFWNDVKSGKMKDAEVEMLGFKRYPELKQEESKKDELEETWKFEAPKLKMKM